METQGDKRHFRGISDIARAFGVSNDTVREWREEGAPLVFIGKCWHCSYYDLWEWLKSYYSKKPVK